jgi:tRNA dimethylallyltransferase
VGIRLGERFGGEIVSADSVQIYRYLDVGSAKPTPEERARLPHHMIDVRDPDQDFSTGEYVREARGIINRISAAGRVPLVVGGTGLYIRALLGGIVELPSADQNLRRQLREQEKTLGEGTLFRELTRVDPEIAGKISPRNIPRIIRALEVCRLTGKKLSELQRSHSFGDRLYRHLFVCLDPGRPILYERIDNRVDIMIKRGLIEEVSQLLQRGYARELKSMQSLGYRHAAMVVAGETDLDEAIRLMKRDTRRYAKRQLSWFRSEPDALWFEPQHGNKIETVVGNFLGR